MNFPLMPPVTLHLTDGTFWTINGKDKTGKILAQSLSQSMQLSPSVNPSPLNLTIQKGIQPGSRHPDLPLIIGNIIPGKQTIVCKVLPATNDIDLSDQLREFGFILSSSTEARGGILIHGALAEKNGRGIILAGPSDVGKTTASRKLPQPWHSLSDDCTLIVRLETGEYFAHPWPTWSSFLDGNNGQNWDVQSGVPLQAVFMLTQSFDNSVEVLNKAKAVCMLNETAEQAWCALSTEFDESNKQKLRVRRFNNICELSKSIPSYLLHFSREGAFWEKIEEVLI